MKTPKKPLFFAFIALIIIITGFKNWPPSTLVILAGPTGGYFEKTALLLKQQLKEKYNIDVLVKQREDTLNIIKDVNDLNSGINVGFIAQDIKANAYPNVTSLGSIVMQPLFIIMRKDSKVASLSNMQGMRLAISPTNSGTRVIAEDVLNVYGINTSNSNFLPLNLINSYDALIKNEADVAFFLVAAKTPLISKMADNPSLQFLGLSDAPAVASRLGYPSEILLNRGILSLSSAAVPSETIGAVGLPVTVIANKSLHNSHALAIATILKEAFYETDLVSARGTFPNMSIVGHLASNRIAADIYQKEMGHIPFLYQLLPFRFAGAVDQTLTVLGLLLTILLAYNYIGLPRPYELWQRARAEQSLKRFELLRLKAQSEVLSEKDHKKMEYLIKQLESSILFSGVAFNRFQNTKEFFESKSLKRR